MSAIKHNRGTPFDQITSGAIKPGSAPERPAPTGNTGPRSFSELLGGVAEAGVCPCGDQATVQLGMQARPARKKGEGGKGSGIPAAIAKHSAHLCEPCAVRMFDKFRRDTR